jgi:putative PIG3 family NAD(P)H quinone oxidoreductase
MMSPCDDRWEDVSRRFPSGIQQKRIDKTMKAIVVHTGKGTIDLSWETISAPSPGPDDVLIDIHATGVNRADLLQARGLYPAPPGDSPILGLEAAGQIRAVGTAVEAWVPGDRVCALAPGGGYAEQVVLPQGLLIPLPDQWSYIQGAAVPEVWLTAYSNLCLEGAMRAGETVLIHAGASGVGTAAIQLGREMGARVAVTAGSDEKLERCRKLGAVMAINYKTNSFDNAVMSFTDHQGVDLILDCIGGPYLAQNIAILKPYGRLVTIGIMGGSQAPLDMAAVLMKSLTLKGTRLRARSREEKSRITREFRDRIWPLMVAGKIVPVVDRVFPITAACKAHQYVKDNRNIGKVILEVRSEN